MTTVATQVFRLYQYVHDSRKNLLEMLEDRGYDVNHTLVLLNISRVLMKVGVKDKVDEDFVNDLYNRKGYFLQLFGLENFLINISKHQFVPKHRVLSKQETEDLLDKYKISVDNIPTIKRDDAQAKYIGLRQHQICEIIVDNATSGRTVKYRLCVI